MADFLPAYQGDPNLGAGGDNLSVVPDNKAFESSQKAFDNSFAVNIQGQQERLKMLGDTQKTIALLDQDFNVKMWQQKVADRDNMYQEFLKGNASVGDVLPDDDKNIKAAKKNFDDAFMEWNKNINNGEAAKKFKDAADELQKTNARAATRYKIFNDQTVDAANTLLPDEKQAKLDNIKKWSSTKNDDGSMALPTYYEKYQKYDPTAFNGQAVLATTKIPDKDGLHVTPFTTFNYKATKSKVEDNQKALGVESVANHFQHTYFDELTPDQQKKQVDAINEAIETHNANHPEDKVEPLSTKDIGGGKLMLVDSPTDFASKFLLAQNPDKRGQSEFSESGLKILTEQEKIRHDMAMEGANLERNSILLDKWKTQKTVLTQDEQVANQKYTDLTNSIAPTASNELTLTKGFGSVDMGAQPAANQYINGIVYNSKGTKTIGRLLPKMTIYDKDGKDISKDSDYSLKSYDADTNVNKGDYQQWVQIKAKDAGGTVNSRYDVKYYMPNGSEITAKNVWDMLPAQARKDYETLFRTMSKPPTLAQFLKKVAANGNIITQFEGQNGTANPNSILQGERFEELEYGKKGFEGVYAPDETAPVTETPEPTVTP